MSGWRLWALCVALVVAHCLVLVLPCPSTCICKWKGGKQWVECANKNHNDIPEGLDTGTQVLNFSGNNVRVLAKERFQTLGLVNLQRIFLSRCGIAQIADRAFSGLTNLVELDLTQNKITAIPTSSFKDFPSLMKLMLNDNPIKAIPAGAFQPLSYLTNLEMSNCAIESTEDHAFAGLNSLEWLRLEDNRLTGMRGDHILPKTLHGITIHNNPWYCDCRLLDLRSWIKNYNKSFEIEPVCKGPPRLRGVSLDRLKDSDLACLPDVSPPTLFLEIAEGKNVSLLCNVSAIPEASVSWWFQGNVLQNDTMVAPGVRLLYFLEEGKENKKSQLFIYNTNTDDNGTFTCVAENAAGRTQSNFTIRIIVKEDPATEISSIPVEYVMALAGALILVVVVVCVSITVCIMSCRRQKRKRRKHESGKAVALQSQTGKGSASDRLSAATGGSKINGTVYISDRNQHELAPYAARQQNSDTANPTANGSDYFTPSANRSYTLEQNPDLINDAESVGKERRLKTVEESDSYQEAKESVIDDIPPSTQPTWPDGRYPMAMPVMDVFHQPLSADVHLSAGRFLDSEGYPMDYGLPKLPLPHPGMAVHQVPMSNLYRTLPHKPRLHTATVVRRYSREAEFLSRPTQNAYEQFHPPDVRYTVDGYPTTAAPVPVSPGATLYPVGQVAAVATPENSILPSPPSAYKTDAVLPSPFPSASCCGSTICPARDCDAPLRCSVAAQTTSEELNRVATTTETSATSCAQPTLTESPDEGYEGEGVDSEM